MSEPVRASCEDCGKTYRVPSADRTYTCKACGGTVSVEGATAPARPAKGATPVRPRRRGRTPEDGTAEDGEERPRRSRPKDRTGLIVWAVVGAVVLGGIGWMLTGGSGPAGRKGEPDLNKVIAGFDVAWNAGDLDALLALLHPDKLAEYDQQLQTVRKSRGWESGHPAVTESATPDGNNPDAVAQGDGANIKASLSVHKTAVGAVVCRWQFNPSNETWYIYQLEIPPPDLLARLDGFEPAWNAADEDALRPFLDPSKADKLLFAFAKVADRENWSEVYPQLTGRKVNPDPRDLQRLGFTMMYKRVAKVDYDTEHGTYMVRWKMLRDVDAWCVSSIDPP